jgi:hypothetical protein
MIGYIYFEHYIFTVECDRPFDYDRQSNDTDDQMVYPNTAQYITRAFTVINIEDINENSVEHFMYKIGDKINSKKRDYFRVYFDKSNAQFSKVYQYRVLLKHITEKEKLKHYTDISENDDLHTVHCHHANGRVHFCYSHRRGILEGDYYEYERNGKIKLKCTYKNGKKHGKYIQYNHFNIRGYDYRTIYINEVDINDIDFDSERIYELKN